MWIILNFCQSLHEKLLHFITIRYFQHFRGVVASGSLRVESSSFSHAAEMRLYLRRAPAELSGRQIVAPPHRRHGAPAGISEPVSSWRGRVEDTSTWFKQKTPLPCGLGAVTLPTGAPNQPATERLLESPAQAVCPGSFRWVWSNSGFQDSFELNCDHQLLAGRVFHCCFFFTCNLFFSEYFNYFDPFAGSVLREPPSLWCKLHDSRPNRHQQQLLCKNLCCPGDEWNSKSLSCWRKLFFNGTLFA